MLNGTLGVLDKQMYDADDWFDAISDLQECIILSHFDEFGNYRYREVEQHFFDTSKGFMHTEEHKVVKKQPEF